MAKKKLRHGPRIKDKARKPTKSPASSSEGTFGGLNLPTEPYKKKPKRIQDKPRR